MSQPHVDEMNRLLAASDEVNALCAQFDRSYRIQYLLTDGPAGKEVIWRMSFSPEGGARLELGIDNQSSDLTISTGYAAMVRSSRAAREGVTYSEDDPATYQGDTSLLQELQPVLLKMREVATVEVTWPDLGDG